MNDKEVPLVEAAAKLHMSYNQTLRWIMIGRLQGLRRNGRWFVSAADLRRFESERGREDRAAPA